MTVKLGIVGHVVYLADKAIVDFPLFLEVESKITFRDGVTAYLEGTHQYLALQQHIQSPQVLKPSDKLELEYKVSTIKSIHLSISHILSFSSHAWRSKERFVNQFLALSHYVNPDTFHHIINFVQSVTVAKGRSVIQNLIINSVAKANTVRFRRFVDTINFVSSSNGFFPTPSFIQIPIDPPIPTTHITLTYGSRILMLKNPEFGNNDKYEQSRILRRNRGGDLEIFRSPIWPTAETLTYNFKFLSQQNVFDLMDFIEASIGQNILLTDYEGRNWQGIITTPAKDVVQEGRFDFGTSFEFLGTPAG